MTYTPIDFALTINGVDVTSYVDLENEPPQITSALDEELDTFTCKLLNADSVNPVEWQEVVVTDNGVKIFAGYIMDIDKAAGENILQNDYRIGCSDYGAKLGRVIVREEYEDKTDAEIITAIFAGSTELADYDVSTYIVTLATLPKVRFNRVSVRDAIDWLCNQTGGHWYVDYDKKLHYFGSEEFTAPYNVTDSLSDTSKINVEDISISTSGANIVNLVEVVGGNYLSEDKTDALSANGYNTTVKMLNRMKPPDGETKIIVRRNDGGPTTNLIVNPSFEVNITDGWTQYQAGTGAAWAQDAVRYVSGSKSLKIIAGTAVTVVQGQNITLNAGETLTVQAQVWSPVVGTAAVVIWDVGNSLNRGECYNRKSSQWELVTAGYYNDTGAALTVRCELYNNANDSSSACYYDAVQAEKLTWPSAYCDGSLGTGYAWTGTANNSTSTRADMPVWTTLTVKAGNTQTLGARNECLYYEIEALLEQETYWPGLQNGIEVDGRYEIPMRTRVRNQASHDHYGMWLEGVVIAPEIIDKTVAQKRGKTELANCSFANPAITYITREPGLRAGQTQNIVNAQRGLDGNYLIQRVTTAIGTGGYSVATVEVGALDQEFVRLLLELKRKSAGEVDWNDNEVLDELLDISEEITVDEDTPQITANSRAYKYGDGCKWGFTTWG